MAVFYREQTRMMTVML